MNNMSLENPLPYGEFKKTYNIELNEQQEKALLAVDGAHALLAVPGSGKTTVSARRNTCVRIMREEVYPHC